MDSSSHKFTQGADQRSERPPRLGALEKQIAQFDELCQSGLEILRVCPAAARAVALKKVPIHPSSRAKTSECRNSVAPAWPALDAATGRDRSSVPELRPGVVWPCQC